MWGICSSPTSTDKFSTPGYSLRPLGDGDARYVGTVRDDFSKVVGQLYLVPPTYQVVRPSRVGICTVQNCTLGQVSSPVGLLYVVVVMQVSDNASERAGSSASTPAPRTWRMNN
jgi:hypothetical protein